MGAATSATCRSRHSAAHQRLLSWDGLMRGRARSGRDLLEAGGELGPHVARDGHETAERRVNGAVRLKRVRAARRMLRRHGV